MSSVLFFSSGGKFSRCQKDQEKALELIVGHIVYFRPKRAAPGWLLGIRKLIRAVFFMVRSKAMMNVL